MTEDHHPFLSPSSGLPLTILCPGSLPLRKAQAKILAHLDPQALEIEVIDPGSAIRAD